MKKILFRADGNAGIGLGHLYRIFALVEMLKDSFECVLLTREDSSLNVIPASYQRELIPTAVTTGNEPDWLSANYSPNDYRILADGYQFTATYQKALKQAGYQLAYIDDLAAEHMHADLVVNHSPGVSEADYRREAYTRLALGTKYAILRPAFLEAAAQTRHIQTIDTAFVCFGGADAGDLTLKAVNALLNIDSINKINVVAGGAYKHTKIFELEKENARLKIYRNISEGEMIGVMQESNFGIVPASNILYELCTVKMPILTGYYVENQKNIYKGCLEKGCFYGGGDFSSYDTSQFEEKIRQVILEGNFDKTIESQAALFDSRIRERFLDLFSPVQFRKAQKEDMRLLFDWSNEKLTRANSYASEPIALETHRKWFEKKLLDQNAIIYIAEVDNEPAGMVRYDIGNTHAVVGVIVSEKFRGRGLAPVFLKRTAQAYFEQSSLPVQAYIKKENTASVRSFEKAGYRLLREELVQAHPSFVYLLEN